MLRLVKCRLCNVRYSYVSSSIGKAVLSSVQFSIGVVQWGSVKYSIGIVMLG